MSAPTTDSMMYQTMHRQPDDLRRLLDTGWEPAQNAAERLAGARRVFLVGIGTSYHAAQIGAWLLAAAGSDARAVLSFDFARYPEQFGLGADDAVIVMAHTGVKRFSAEALETAVASGATVLSVGSLTAEHPGSQLILRTVEREKSAAYTSSHLCAMTVLAQVATCLGEKRGVSATVDFRTALQTLPDQVAEVLAREDEVLPVAREAATLRVYAAGLPLEQFAHGPMVAVNADDLIVLINVPGAAQERVREVAAVLAAVGARLWLVGEGVDAVPDATVFQLPAVPEMISPLLTVVPMQMLAYQMAVVKGVNPDTFRRDDPTYAAAFGLMKL